jgi:ferredoxin--NADP+ reductase
MGTNRTCAEETVSNLLSDFTAGTLCTRTVATGDALHALMRDRGVEYLGWDGWAAIDAAERQRGKDAGRPRAKYVSVEEMWGIATASRSGQAS